MTWPVCVFGEICEALLFIENDESQKAGGANEAKDILLKLGRLETAVIWGFVLNRMNTTKKRLQSVDIHVLTVIEV
jgi:hypothetical protein